MKSLSSYPSRQFYLFIILVMFGCISSFSQQTDSASNNKRTIDSTLATENLNRLPGQPETFYSDGFSVRARAIQGLLHRVIAFYEPLFPLKKFNVRLYMLNKPDWDKPRFEQPYGMPFYHERNEIMIVAAEKNALRRLTGLPDDPEKSDSVLSMFDYQPVHELGHYFFYTLNGVNKEKWFNEFLANYFLICFLKEKNLEPDLEAKMKADYTVKHRSLDDFQKLYGDVGPSNYHWYQQKFIQLGFALYPVFKTSLIKQVLQNYQPGGKQLEGADVLKNLSPAIVNAWLKEMQ